MPEEVFIIVIVAILAGTFAGVVKTIVNYLQSRSSGSSGESRLTTSELERMMQKAVKEATQPLLEKVDDLERRLASAERPKQLEEGQQNRLQEQEREISSKKER